MKKEEFQMNRRHMLKGLGLGTMAYLFPGFSAFRPDPYQEEITQKSVQSTLQKVTNSSSVSLVKGNDGRDNTFAALMNIEDNIMASLEGKKRILIKPNFVSTEIPLCSTSVDSVRGILDFLKPRWKGQIVVGESTANRQGTMAGFKNYGYLPLEREYGVQLVDLNETTYQTRFTLGPDNTPIPMRIISTFLDKDQYVISAAKMKTHDRVLVTLSLKNILLAAPFNDYKNNDKPLMHRSNDRSKTTVLHYNMFRLAQEVYPDLGVIDGFESMEGNGPTRGTPVDTRIAMASLDPLALDTVATKIMGFDPNEILYLSSMNKAGMGQGDLDKIQVVGSDITKIQYHFEAHPAMVESYGLG